MHKKHGKPSLPFDTIPAGGSPPQFITNFISSHNTVVKNADEDRSWFFEEKDTSGNQSHIGYLRYGIFGFESDFVDNVTQAKKYRRQVNDSEQIPLFYQFWFPDDNTHRGYIVMQSFQGRSCVQLVTGKIRDDFAKQNDGYTLRFSKLLPMASKNSLYPAAAVKRLTLIKRNASADIADRYIGSHQADPVDFELSISARPKKSLSDFQSLFNSLNARQGGVIVYDGIEFPEAVAEVRVGKKLRRVTMFGGDSDAGVIDITNDVKRGSDGHPTFESLITEANEILVDFHSAFVRS